MSLDWSNLKSYKSSKNKSFEQLCFQIANKKFEGKGEFWPIDDSGGGDGVEFYLELKTKVEWGWQAKFYEGSVRLSQSSRKSSIIGSLRKALKVHPNLTQWYLCTNSDLTPKEKIWFDNVLTKEIPQSRKVKLIHWGEAKIYNFLNEHRFKGLKNAFFNDLELNIEWFQSNFDNFFHLVESKYNSDLHTKDSELQHYYIGPLLSDIEFKDRLDSYIKSLEVSFSELKEDLSKLDGTNFSGTTYKKIGNDYIKAIKLFIKNCDKTVLTIQRLVNFVTPNQIDKVTKYDYKQLLNSINQRLNKAKEIRKIPLKFLQDKPDNYSNKLDRINRLISSIERNGDNVINEVKYFFEHSKQAEYKYLHLFGRAGIGKTHLTVDLANNYLIDGIPAIYIPAVKFHEDQNLETQILEVLDVKSEYSFSDFLKTLQSIGRILNKRIPIIIDGLNESVNANGVLNKIWARDIGGLEEQIKKNPNLVLITTCRISYKKNIWKQQDRRELHDIYGFNSEEDVRELVKKYFKEYKLIGDLSYLSLSQFRRPLILKIYCETKNPTKSEEIQVTLGKDSIYDTFEAFIDRCDENIFKSLTEKVGLPPKSEFRKVAKSNLPKYAKLLWESKSRNLTFDDFFDLVDSGNNEYYKSKTKALENEGLLFKRDWFNDNEVISFTYDLFAGYIIAEYLIESTEDLREFIKSEEFFNLLLSGDIKKRHPLAEDVFECFTALLPQKKGYFFHDVAPEGEKYIDAYFVSIVTLFSVTPELISDDQIKLLSDLFKYEVNQDFLLSEAEDIFFITDHPFNITYWSGELKKLSMIRRDLLWTEFIRGRGEEYLFDILNEFEQKVKPNIAQTAIEKKRTILVANYIRWLLTSTNEKLRDKATEALYWFGRKYVKEFILLLKDSISINDPYVFERIAAGCYGIVMALRYSFKQNSISNKDLSDIALFLYNSLFKPDAMYSTTHALTRDYAACTIQIALEDVPKLSTICEKKFITPPFSFGGVRNWGESLDFNEGEYRDGNAMIDYYFKKNRMPHIVSKGDMYNPSEKFEKALARIRWRAYQLGYDFNSLKDLDKRIERLKHTGHEYLAATDKYGEKYTLIAFYELAGFMEDEDSIEDEYDFEDIRFSDTGIDPSFFKEIKEYKLIEDDYLGSWNNNIEEWLKNFSVPKFHNYLITENLQGEKGKWVMLDCSIDQLDKKTERNVKIFVGGFLVKDIPDQMESIIDKVSTRGRHLTQLDQLHADEVPLSPLYQKFGKEVWHYVESTKTEIVKYKVFKLFKNNVELSFKEEDKFWKKLELVLEDFITTPREVKHESPIVFPFTLMKTFEGIKGQDRQPLIEEHIKEAGLTGKVIEISKKDETHVENEIEVFVPQVRVKKGIMLAKEICEFLSLIGQPQDSNLYLKNGEVASMNFGFGKKYNNYQSFHYIRKDLLDKYLKQNKLKLAWGIWGERQHYPKDMDTRGDKPWTDFEEIKIYKN